MKCHHCFPVCFQACQTSNLIYRCSRLSEDGRCTFIIQVKYSGNFRGNIANVFVKWYIKFSGIYNMLTWYASMPCPHTISTRYVNMLNKHACQHTMFTNYVYKPCLRTTLACPASIPCKHALQTYPVNIPCRRPVMPICD